MLVASAIVIWIALSVPFGIMVGKAMGHGLGAKN